MSGPGDNLGIEILIEPVDELKDHFQMLPNALLRGDRDEKYDFDFRGYSMRERGLLGALVGMQSGYRCDRARIDALLPELGPDGVDTVVRGLKRRGHLRTTRINDPDRRGKFVWRWQISLRPMFVNPDPPVEETPGQSMGGPATYGWATDGSAMDGSAMDGPAIGGSAGSYYKEGLGVLEGPGGLENQPPPPDARHLSGPRAETSGGGGDSQPQKEPQSDDRKMSLVAAGRAVLERVLDVSGVVGARRLRGRPAETLAGRVAVGLAAGWAPDQAVEALSGSFKTATTVAGAMGYRVDAMLAAGPPTPATAAPGRPPWCGECDSETGRWRLDEEGRAYRCPECYPAIPGVRPSTA